MKEGVAQLEHQEMIEATRRAQASAQASGSSNVFAIAKLKHELRVAQRDAEMSNQEVSKLQSTVLAETECCEDETKECAAWSEYTEILGDENFTLTRNVDCLTLELTTEQEALMMLKENYKLLGRFKDGAQRSCNIESEMAKSEAKLCGELREALSEAEDEVYGGIWCATW